MYASSMPFAYLIIAVKELLSQERPYPYPMLFQHVCNYLALCMPVGKYPRTLTGLLGLFQQPVQEWWPAEVPLEFNTAFGIVYEGRISEEAEDYFYTRITDDTNILRSQPSIVQLGLENNIFRSLLERLQTAESKTLAQEEYVLLRSFLIEHPYATTEKIRETFLRTQVISISDVGSLYEACPADHECWNCNKCGPLIRQHRHLRGIKPDICADHREESPHVRLIPWQHGLGRIKAGIHWRVSQPGKAEMRLFHELEKLRQGYPQQLIAVALWPGIDRYDLQIRFGDDIVWAVDVKDYRNPSMLAPELVKLYGEGNFRYDESFYVFPLHQIHRNPQYIEVVRAIATQLSTTVKLLHEVEFLELVFAKINSLRTGRK